MSLLCLKKNAPKKWNAVINQYTYQFMIDATGHKDKDVTKNATAYNAAEARSPAPPAKKAKKDNSEQKAAEAQQKKEEQEMKQKRLSLQRPTR